MVRGELRIIAKVVGAWKFNEKCDGIGPLCLERCIWKHSVVR